MHYLLFIAAFLFFAFIAPIKVTLVTCVLMLLITTTVKVSARLIADAETSYGEAFKAVGFAFFFLLVVLFTLVSFSKGTGISQFSGLPALGVIAAFFAAYIAGFRLGLGVTFGASAAIALVSTIISTILVFVFKAAL